MQKSSKWLKIIVAVLFIAVLVNHFSSGAKETIQSQLETKQIVSLENFYMCRNLPKGAAGLDASASRASGKWITRFTVFQASPTETLTVYKQPAPDPNSQLSGVQLLQQLNNATCEKVELNLNEVQTELAGYRAVLTLSDILKKYSEEIAQKMPLLDAGKREQIQISESNFTKTANSKFSSHEVGYGWKMINGERKAGIWLTLHYANTDKPEGDELLYNGEVLFSVVYH